MSTFEFQNGELFAENTAVSAIVEQYGSPCYIYSRTALENHYLAYANALANTDHLICYAVKANSNLAVLNILAKLGSGFDIVSEGELARVIAAGGDPAKVVFSGVGKTAQEMRAALAAGIYCFNVESEAELYLLAAVAEAEQKVAKISIRVNPDIDAQTHPYISTGLQENKFGIPIESVVPMYQFAATSAYLDVSGVDCHIGSQLTTSAPFSDALDRVLLLIDELNAAGITLHHIDMGGGLGVCYTDEQPPSVAEYIAPLLSKLAQRNVKLILEPGRSIAANAGILVSKVEFLKPSPAKNFAIIDAAMNDMIRPALYQAEMRAETISPSSETTVKTWDLVGPVCETGDFLAKNRDLALNQGDYIAFFGAGAYGFTMSSNYNSRPRPPEIIVDKNQCHLVRPREDISDLIRGEKILP